MFEYFTDKAISVVMKAQEEARRLGHNFVGTEQILLGLLAASNGIAVQALKQFNLKLDAARTEVEAIIGRGSGNVPAEIPFTPKAKRIFEQAVEESRRFDHRYIGPEHLLLSLTRDPETVASRVLQNLGVSLSDLRSVVIRLLGDEPVAAAEIGSRTESVGSARSPRRRGRILDDFSTDLTEKARNGELDPMIGRSRELERVIQILGRRTKNNPILVGEPGVGKTAIAEGLAQRIVNGDVPPNLEAKRVIQLDMAAMISGTRFRGDFEERITQVLSEVREDENIVLMIDEIHTLIGAGSLEGGMDAANMFKPALARGELQCIGATTLDEFRSHIERDAALERRFQPVMVGEPTVEATIEILYGLRGRYEQHHRLTIADAALDAAAQLSSRYITDRFLPDKAIDLIDEAGSRVRLRYAKHSNQRDLKRQLRQLQKELNNAVQVQDFDQASQLRDQELALEHQLYAASGEDSLAAVLPTVEVEDIAHIVASWTGVPVTQLTESESVLLLHLEDTLHERLIGQAEAVSAVARAVRRARTGLGSPDRPIASFIFSGPTGVGKTELAKALATTVFGSEEAMIRLDMSEYMERHTVSKLIGSPPGFVGYDEGGQLTEAVRRRPYTVILLDEIEKAHPDVFNTLLQVLDDGRLSDAKGRMISFKNTIIVMTSNIGSKVIEKGGNSLGFDFALDDVTEAQYRRIQERVNEELKQYFRPEFLNRLDEVIVFRQLTRDEVSQIAELMLLQVVHQVRDRQIAVEVSAAMKARLITEGYDPSYGARPMRRAISRLVEDPLAEAILDGRIVDGDTAYFDLDDDSQVFVQPAKQPALVGTPQW